MESKCITAADVRLVGYVGSRRERNSIVCIG